MDLEKQLLEFYSQLDYKPVSSNAISVYLVLLIIAKKVDWIDEFKLSNSFLISKCKINTTALSRARTELINNGFIRYKKGLNQIDTAKYTIIRLYKDEKDLNISANKDERPNAIPNNMPNAIPNDIASDNIITTLDCFFKYININNIKSDFQKKINFENVQEADRQGIRTILKKLDVLIEDENIICYFTQEQLENYYLQYWAVKELYFRPEKIFLNKITAKQFMYRFLKAKKYAKENNMDLKRFIEYFIVCIKNEMEAQNGIKDKKQPRKV